MLLRLYAGVSVVAEPILRWHLRRRSDRGREIAARLDERRGLDPTPRPEGRLVWLHAASVGETLSILPVVAGLLRRPEVTVLVTTGTVTSAELLHRRMGEFAAPGRVLHRFVPLDVRGWVRRFVSHWRPNVAGFVESEIWPNLIRALHDAGVPIMLINGRMSPASLRMWSRIPGTARRLFGMFEAVEAQSDVYATRFLALGARHVTSPGDLKSAAPPLPVDAAELARLQALLAGRPVWLAAQTHPGEERIACDIHDALADAHPGLLTVIAPRHPERGGAIAAELHDPGLTRRALGQDPPPGGIWLADTLGELGLLYRLSPIVFVGRSLAVGGGHNPLEPARLGCAVATGLMATNFDDALATLGAAGAIEIVRDSAALQAWVAALLADSARVAAMSEAGRRVATDGAGLPDAVAGRLLALIP